MLISMAQHDIGHAPQSQQALDALAARADGPEGNVAYRVALVHSWRGESDSAFEWLERAYARHDLELRWLKNDLFLRQDPRRPALRRLLAEDEPAGGMNVHVSHASGRAAFAGIRGPGMAGCAAPSPNGLAAGGALVGGRPRAAGRLRPRRLERPLPVTSQVISRAAGSSSSAAPGSAGRRGWCAASRRT